MDVRGDFRNDIPQDKLCRWLQKDYVIGCYSRLFSYSQIEPANLIAILGIEENRCQKKIIIIIKMRHLQTDEKLIFLSLSSAINRNRK